MAPFFAPARCRALNVSYICRHLRPERLQPCHPYSCLSDENHNRIEALSAMRKARDARRDEIARKEAKMAAYLKAAESNSRTNMGEAAAARAEDERLRSLERWRNEERSALLMEASAITKSLYRICLRCVEVIRPGNEHDEDEFRAREEAHRNELEELEKGSHSFGDSSTAVSLPVDRENELGSRAEYYYRWARENFEGDSHLLDADPWLEENIDRFLYHIRDGEEKRKWILKDYKFEDPYPLSFDQERVSRFEERARRLVKETYDAKGWILPSSIKAHNWRDDIDDDYGEEYDEEP